MARSFASLALAASSYPRSREDRLTELYAVALEEHPGFATRVFELAELPAGVRFEAYTQESLADGSGRIDLRVRGLDAADQVVAVLYAEHKEPGGGFQPEQPEKYLRALQQEARETDADARFMVVVGSGDDLDGHLPHHVRSRTRKGVAKAALEATKIDARRSPLVVGRTWQQIANCAELAGRRAYPDDDKLLWRDAAEAPDAQASQRILRELLWYFEEEGYAVTNGLTTDQVALAVQALEVEDTLSDLIDATTPLITKARFGKHRLEAPRGGGKTIRGQDFKVPPGSWIERWNGSIWLAYVADAKSVRSSAPRTLQFQIGVWLPRKEATILDKRAVFKTQLGSLKQDLAENGYIWAQAPAAEFVSEDPDELLDAQAARLAGWVMPQIQKILGLRPGRAPSEAR